MLTGGSGTMNNPKVELTSLMVETYKMLEKPVEFTESIEVNSDGTTVMLILTIPIDGGLCTKMGIDSNRLVTTNVMYLVDQLTLLINHLKEERNGAN